MATFITKPHNLFLQCAFKTITTNLYLVRSGRVLASSAGGPGSNPFQGPRHTKDVTNGTSISLV